MARILAYSETIPTEAGTECPLSAEESHHILRVLRVRPGYPLTLIDGKGKRAQAHLSETSGRHACVTIESVQLMPRPRPAVTLGQSIPKGNLFDDIIRKATELGVARITPLITDHTEVREERVREKHARWNTIALEACKQSGNPYLPQIDAPMPLDAWYPSLSAEALKCIGSLEAQARPLHAYKQAIPQEAAWLIGPEGDFSPREYASAREQGFLPVRFTPYVLRVETAALYALSIIHFTFTTD